MTTEISPDIWKKFSQGQRLACARLMSFVENRPERLAAIRDKLLPMQKGAIRIGITGPPGVGKSTVTAALTRYARRRDRRVGIIAVDPSSPFTGGAFLGDRIRMQDIAGDPDVFIRSLASRDGQGGLSPSTPYIAEVLDAFGMDWILIETVGVGQAELDVLRYADIIVLVMQPSTGDAIQTLKAGILEAGDIYLINKADLPGADVLEQSLRFMLDMGKDLHDKPIPPIIMASAVRDEGIDSLFDALEDRIQMFISTGRFKNKRQALIEADISRGVRELLWRRFLEITQSEEEIRRIAGMLVEKKGSPYPHIEQLTSRIILEPAHKEN